MTSHFTSPRLLVLLVLAAAGCPADDGDPNNTFVTTASVSNTNATGNGPSGDPESGESTGGPGGTSADTSTDPSTPPTTAPVTDTTTDPTAVECVVPPPGSDTGAETVTPTAENIIDDFEDGDGAITDQGGRAGYWYTYDDGTSTVCPQGDFLPVAGGPNASVNAAVFSALEPFTMWGAGLGVDLNSVDGVRSVYDASAYTGIVFQVRGTVATARVSLPIPATVAEANGGTCVADGTTGCDDNFGFDLTGLTTSWAQVQVPFADLTQAGWGVEVPAFDPTQILGIQWQVANGSPFEFGLDAVAFY